MSTNRARSFGLAIIVAIGVIAAMAAMGLFSIGPAHADEHNVTATGVTFTPATYDVSEAGDWTVEFTRGTGVSDLLAGDEILITFPDGVELPTTGGGFDSTAVKVEADGKEYPLATDDGVATSSPVVTLTLPDASTDDEDDPLYPIAPGTKVTVTFKSGEAAGDQITNPDVAGTAGAKDMASGGSVSTALGEDSPDDNVPAAAGFPASLITFVARVGEVVFAPTSMDVNAPAAWDVSFQRPPTTSGNGNLEWGTGTISITFPEGVVVPTAIDKSRVTVTSTEGTDTESHRPTTDPTVNGNTVTVDLPFADAAAEAISPDIVPGAEVTVKFSQPAGILNPSARGEAGTAREASAGSVETSVDEPARNAAAVTDFKPTITLDKSSSPEGGPVEVTLGGFTPGLQVTLSGAVSGSGTVKSDGTAVVSGTMGSATGKVTATDGAGDAAETTDDIMVTATLTATATGKAQDTITLTGKNFDVAANIPLANIKFGGESLHPEKRQDCGKRRGRRDSAVGTGPRRG